MAFATGNSRGNTGTKPGTSDSAGRKRLEHKIDKRAYNVNRESFPRLELQGRSMSRNGERHAEALPNELRSRQDEEDKCRKLAVPISKLPMT